MYRLSRFVFLAATMVTLQSGHAQEPTGMAAVSGLAMNDLLNVREKASPLGKTLGRLENGALVTKYECEIVNEYEWCRIAAVDATDVKGWAPARYLLPLDIEVTPPIESESASSDGTAEAPTVAGGPTDPLPPAFNERFGGDAQEATNKDEADVAAVRGLAERLRPTPEPQVEPPAGTMPRPTPRPTTNDTAAAAPSAPATAEPPAPALVSQAPQSGFIPCARHVGQPMQQCTATVLKRIGNAEADVAVAFPDGGMRIIEFRDKKPAGSDSDAKLTFTREGTLNMIRIGVSERFEIVDALAFGS